MKNLKYLILILVFISCKKETSELKKAELKPSKIDSLNTSIKIEEYIHRVDSLNFGTPYWNYRLKKLQDLKYESIITAYGRKLADSLNIKNSFFKTDFDNNGYTDLVVTGYFDNNEISYNYVLMNYGKDSIEIKDINAFRHAFTVPKIITENEQPFLQVSYPDMINPYGDRKITTVTKKLVHKFGGFIEFNQNPRDYSIEKIEFSLQGCMGSCPVFELIINRDKSLIYSPRFFNFSDDGNKEETQQFKRKLSSKEYAELESLLNYINFPRLKNYYAENTSDGQSAKIKIMYRNGKIKTIEDHLYPGNYGLRRLYEIMFEIRKNTAGNSSL